MLGYYTEALHLSEGEAYLRIAVARASREHPMLLPMLGDGRLHLSAIALLAPHLSGPGRISWTNLPLTDRLPCHGLDYESRWHTSYAG